MLMPKFSPSFLCISMLCGAPQEPSTDCGDLTSVSLTHGEADMSVVLVNVLVTVRDNKGDTAEGETVPVCSGSVPDLGDLSESAGSAAMADIR